MLHDFQIQVFFLFIAASVADGADTAAVKPSIPNGLTKNFNKGNPDFNNGIKNFKNHPFSILVNCAFENLISADLWLLNAFIRLKVCLVVSNNL